MQSALTPARAANPLARFAERVPSAPAFAISVTLRVVGAAFALYYALDQDRLFPSRHFPRTWVFTSVIAGVALLSIVPWARLLPRLRRMEPWLGAFGCGVLVFGGANLAHKGTGLVVLLAGIAAWAAYTVVAHQRGGAASAVSGLLMGSLTSFLLVGICVLAVGG